MALSKILRRGVVDLVAGDIPNLDTAKITTGTLANARVADLPTSKITSGTFADARISSSSVVQHSPETDLQPLKSDLTALALREATNESSAAFNLPNQFIETFTDDTNLGTQTTGDRSAGYWGTIVSGVATAFDYGGVAASARADVWRNGAHSAYTSGSWVEIGAGSGGAGFLTENIWDAGTTTTSASAYWASSGGTNDWRKFDYQTNQVFADKLTIGKNNTWGDVSQHKVEYSTDNSNWTAIDFSSVTQDAYFDASGGTYGQFTSGTSGGLINVAANSTGNTYRSWTRITGMPTFTARYLRHTFLSIHSSANSNTGLADFIPYIQNLTTNATGTLIQSANTVGSNKTKVGGTMLYKDNSGTATLGTDLKIYFSCNNGTNWTEAASYSAITPVYSTGVKQVRLGETTCTQGTGVIYKAVWANQASGSKETQLHGIGLNY